MNYHYCQIVGIFGKSQHASVSLSTLLSVTLAVKLSKQTKMLDATFLAFDGFQLLNSIKFRFSS